MLKCWSKHSLRAALRHTVVPRWRLLLCLMVLLYLLHVTLELRTWLSDTPQQFVKLEPSSLTAVPESTATVQSAFGPPPTLFETSVPVDSCVAASERKRYLYKLASAPDLSTLESWSSQFNSLPPLNHQKFALEEGFIPIVILVHERALYLKQAIELYRSVVNISKTMLIISHDGIYPEVLDLVLSIDYCQVKQLVFPYHIRWMENVGALARIGYQVWFANAGALKLHWTWALTQAWYNVLYSSNATYQVDEVAYMEDDFFVTKDFYVALKAMKKLKSKVCTCDRCFASTVGYHGFQPKHHRNSSSSTVFRCNSNSYTGISFSRREWTHLRSLYDQYCTLRNNHWDDGWHRLMNGRHPLLPPTVLSVKAPRAIHVGRCEGLHFSSRKCDVQKIVEKFESTFQPSRDDASSDFEFKEPPHWNKSQAKCASKFRRKRQVGYSDSKIWPPNYLKTCYHLSHPSFQHVTWGAMIGGDGIMHVLRVVMSAKREGLLQSSARSLLPMLCLAVSVACVLAILWSCRVRAWYTRVKSHVLHKFTNSNS